MKVFWDEKRSGVRRAGTLLAVAVFMSAVWVVALPSLASASLPAECAQSGTMVTCTYSTGDNIFVVPTGIGTLHVVAVGGSGANSNGFSGFEGLGGSGARVAGDLSVDPGQSLHVVVGGNGSGGDGGVNGGGDAGLENCGGGGGASDIRGGTELSSRLLVAAGGGGAGCPASSEGFDGGDAGVGGSGAVVGDLSGGGGQSGCQTATATNCGAGGQAGNGNLDGTAGANGSLGTGGEGGPPNYGSGAGGGGGGGVFGGGGGGGGGASPTGGNGEVTGAGGGGGGGSSLVPLDGSLAIDTSGVPQITISYDSTEPVAVTFTSGAPPSGTVGDAYTFTYTATGDSGITFEAAGNLPPGVLLASDGTLSGTPTTSGSYTFTVTATGSSSAVAQRTDTAQISPAATPPVASASPTSIDFGSRVLGTTSAAQTVTLTNTGGSALTINPIPTGVGVTGSDFALASDNCSAQTLDPGESCTASVTFSPTVNGARSGSLSFNDSAADSPQTVSLSGTGTPPPAPIASVSPASIDFGDHLIGTTSSARTVTLTNSGDAPLEIIGIIMRNFGIEAPFRVASNGCSDSVEPGGSCSLGVTFTPGTDGFRSGEVVIRHNAAGAETKVALSGTGVPPSADLAVSISASPNPAKPGSKITYTITVLNAGPSTATNVLLNDTLSPQSTFVSASFKQGQGSCVTPSPGASGTVSCKLGSIASGGSNVTQIVVTVIAKKSTITNTASVSCDLQDPNTANNTASITTRVK